MKRFLCGLLALALFIAPAYATQLSLTGAGVQASGACTPSYAYNNLQFTNGVGPTFTYTSVPIGTAAANRVIILSGGTRGGTAYSSSTVGGISTTTGQTGAGGNTKFISAATVPTGTTATVSFTVTGTPTSGYVAIYVAYCLSSISANATCSNTSNPSSCSLSIPNNGIGIYSTGSGSSSSWVWTNATKDFEQILTGGIVSGANQQLTIGAVNNATASPTPGTSVLMVGASYN